MDGISLAISTISVAKVCLQTTNVIQGMKSFSTDLDSLYTRYHFEHVRLTLWLVQVLGVQSEQGAVQGYKPDDVQIPEYLGSASPIDLQAPLRAALTQIDNLLKEIKKVLDKYEGTKHESSGSTTQFRLAERAKLSISRRVKFQTRVYKEGDKEKLKSLLQDLKDWNDGLHTLTGSRLQGQLAANMRNRVLTSADTDDQLQVIEDASRDTYPALSSEAAFKRQSVTIDQTVLPRQNALRIDVNSLRPGQPSPQQDESHSLRALGWVLRGQAGNLRILQEWKLGQLDWTAEEVSKVRDRTDRLAQVLHLDNKPQQLCCLDLVGYATKDSTEGNRTRLDICFLYRLPSFADHNSVPKTLTDALDLPDQDRPNLAERFHLATTLAESVLCFHSHNWIHKAICSSNIIFFNDSQGRCVNYSKPFMAGFEFARPDTAIDRTFDTFTGHNFEVYCHPDLRQTLRDGRATRPRYQRQYDIYGLGIILLEIGCWVPATMSLTLRAEESTETDHDFLLSICDEYVPSRMGTKFRDIVKMCLNWRADDEKLSSSHAQSQEGIDQQQNQIEEFMYNVVDALRGCHCHI